MSHHGHALLSEGAGLCPDFKSGATGLAHHTCSNQSSEEAEIVVAAAILSNNPDQG